MEVLISNYEKNFIIDGIQEGLRNDGRSLTDYRPISVETRVLAGPNGSARVQIVGSTDVLVAVKAELNSVEKGEQLVQNRIKFFVDISANASPKFAGRGGNELGEEMARTFHTAFDNDLVLPDMRKLVLAPTHCWLLHVDVLILQYGGNAMDAISLGVKAALSDTEIPTVIVRPADEGKVLIDMPDEASSWRMDVSRVPLVVTVNRIGDNCIFDADFMEELCSTSTLYIGVQPSVDEGSNDKNDDNLITCLKKIKGGSLELESMDEMIEKSIGVAKALDHALMGRLQMEMEMKIPQLFRSIL